MARELLRSILMSGRQSAKRRSSEKGESGREGGERDGRGKRLTAVRDCSTASMEGFELGGGGPEAFLNMVTRQVFIYSGEGGPGRPVEMTVPRNEGEIEFFAIRCGHGTDHVFALKNVGKDERGVWLEAYGEPTRQCCLEISLMRR